VYCSNVWRSDGGWSGVFAPNCGQAFAVAAAVARAPMMSSPVAAPIAAVWRPFPRTPDMPPSRAWSTRRVLGAFLAFLIDNAVMGIGFVLILIPLSF